MKQCVGTQTGRNPEEWRVTGIPKKKIGKIVNLFSLVVRCGLIVKPKIRNTLELESSLGSQHFCLALWTNLCSLDFWSLLFFNQRNFQLSFESNPNCIGFALLRSVIGLENARHSQPIRYKTKTNHDMITGVFPRFRHVSADKNASYSISSTRPSS